MNKKFTKCFNCVHRNSSGFCRITACVYIPVKTKTTNETKQQSIVDFKQNHVELNLREYGNIKIEPDVITYNDKVYTATKPQPTLYECVKEWEELGYEWKDNGRFYILTKYYRKYSDLECVKNTIVIWKDNKDYEKTKESITYQEHNLIHKTLKALEGKE